MTMTEFTTESETIWGNYRFDRIGIDDSNRVRRLLTDYNAVDVRVSIDWTLPSTRSDAAFLEQNMEKLTVGTVCVFKVPDPAPEHPDGGQGRLVGVIAQVHEHEGRRWFNLVAAHSCPEMATDHDVIVRGATPYPLVIMGECYAQAWESQVNLIVGVVPAEAIKAAWRAIKDDGESAVAWNLAHNERGFLPLAGPVDPRWSWVEGWLPTLTALSTPVRRCLQTATERLRAD